MGSTRRYLLEPDRSLKVRLELKPKEGVMIETTLKNNTYLFSWTDADLPAVDPGVVVHRLSMFKVARYVTKKRKIEEEGRLAARVMSHYFLLFH